MTMTDHGLQQLREREAAGEALRFVHFWGHTPSRDGVIDKSCLSQWYPAPFVDDDGVRYATAEHFMMVEKARVCGDARSVAAILADERPAVAKDLGRRISPYLADAWAVARFDVVVRGNRLKFAQHPALQTFLRHTGDRILVEASPSDRIWGIGLSATDADANAPSRWRGENLLGFALMEVRRRLMAPST
jgi:ribA/ribD-fused uncharacterized protein